MAGINLTDTTNDPGITLVHNSTEAPGNFDNWNYIVDVSEYGAQFDEGGNVLVDEDGKIAFAPGTDFNQTITITGDWNNLDGGDGWPGAPNGGDYVAAQIPNPGGGVYFGNLNINQLDGKFTWTFTVGDIRDYAGQNYDVYFVGKYGDQESDSDLLKLTITCFLPGTMIATPAGETAIEALSIGDMIRTADGREVAVKWLGRKTIKTSVFLDQTMLPVCISAGAFGNGLPRQDLYLSANHGMIMGGHLVNAGAMVNGSTIRFVALSDMPATFTYYHVETEAHDEILANGTPAETFVDYVTRKGFDNYDEYLAIYGSERIIPEMKRLRVSSRRQLPLALREQLGVASFTDQVTADLDQMLADPRIAA